MSADEGPTADLACALIRWLSHEDAVNGLEIVCGHDASEVGDELGERTGTGSRRGGEDGRVGGHERPDLVVRLPGCLAEIPAHLPVELLVGAGISWVRLRAAGCPRSAEAATIFESLAGLLPGRLLLARDEHYPGTATASGAPRVIDAARLPVRRRALLGVTPDPVTGPDIAASAHRRLLAAVQALLPDGPVTGGDARAPGIRLRVLDAAQERANGGGCTACLTCVRTCPEEALAMPVAGDIARLVELPVRCSGCGACLDACPERVLVLDRQLRWRDQLGPEAAYPLAVVRTAVCARCGARFPADAGEHCAVCAFRVAQPFGSWLPPAAQALLDRRVPKPE